MCGIAGIFLKGNTTLNLINTISKLTLAIKHRGPDGEGFILGNENEVIPFNSNTKVYKSNELKFLPKYVLQQANLDFNFALSHVRLSVIDLTETGHQPMCTFDEQYWITFNGEIYNYIELKDELIKLGIQFFGKSDTEVILNAFKVWGPNFINKLNGMWAFAIIDVKNKQVFASRDRLGVKPFYYVNNFNLFAFASEQKAFVKAELVTAKTNSTDIYQYLINNNIEYNNSSFFEKVTELLPGHNLIYNYSTQQLNTEKYYSLKTNNNLINNDLSDEDLIVSIKEKLINAIKIRLRSDVEVGTCLSGGIDSSAIAVLMQKINNKKINCFTAQFKNSVIDESKFAKLVSGKINANHFFVEPNLLDFEKEVKQLIYSQDSPIWSTSTYAQFKVMELAKQNNTKVVLDGQGADELFAGYHHHFVAQWLQLLNEGKLAELSKTLRKSNVSISSPYIFFLKDWLKSKITIETAIYKKYFTKEFLKFGKVETQIQFSNVNEQLIHDIEVKRLKIFLKCEDRCGMWHGVESRTPFSDDINLIEMLFSFDGKRKIKNGVSKYFLRESVKELLPIEIYKRYDKKGFETPQTKWVLEYKNKMINQIKGANFNFLKPNFESKINLNNHTEEKLFFKLYALAVWQEVFN
jgi:asparagine synthase (glutamine-hydrolysing)